MRPAGSSRTPPSVRAWTRGSSWSGNRWNGARETRARVRSVWSFVGRMDAAAAELLGGRMRLVAPATMAVLLSAGPAVLGAQNASAPRDANVDAAGASPGRVKGGGRAPPVERGPG